MDDLDSQLLGFRISIGYSTSGNGDTEGLTAAADGSFYPDWIDFRSGVGMMQTAKIDVLQTGLPDHAPAAVVAAANPCRPAHENKQRYVRVNVQKSFPANDVTAAYRTYLLNWAYDQQHKIYTADLQVEGPADQLARGVYLELTSGQWPESAAFVKADNGLRGKGARWLFRAPLADASSNARVRSNIRHIRVYVPVPQLHADSTNFYLRVINYGQRSSE